MPSQIYKFILFISITLIGLSLLTSCGKKIEQPSDLPSYEHSYTALSKDINHGYAVIQDGFVYQDQLYLAGINPDDSPVIGIFASDDTLIQEVYPNMDIAAAEPDSHGNIIYIGNSTEDTSGESTLHLSKIDLSGNILFTADISDELALSQGSYITSLASDKEDNIYLAANNHAILLYRKDGTYQGTIHAPYSISDMTASSDGLVYIAFTENDSIAINSIDFTTASLNTPIRLTETSADFSPSFEVRTETSLYEINVEQRSFTKQLDWINCGIEGLYIKNMSSFEDRSYVILLSDPLSSEAGFQILTLKQASSESNTEKITLSYGTMYLDPITQRQITSFNKSNNNYLIQVINYDYESNPEQALIQMNTDLLTGNSPDIIDMKMSHAQKLIAAGILEDLYPYMDSDPDINREDYLDNILQAYEQNGKLYSIMPAFLIRTMAGKSTNVGEAAKWSLADMQELCEQYPDSILFEDATSDAILQMGIHAELSNLVNWETGECNFDGENFIQLLEFASQYGMSASSTNYMEMASKLRSDEYLLTNGYIYNISVYRDEKNWFGEDVTFIGYPTSTASGNFIDTAVCSLAISTGSNHKDGAWEFIKSFLESDYQQGEMIDSAFGFPIQKAAFEILIEQEMTPDFYVDELGKEEEVSKRIWNGYGNEPEIEIFAATEEEMGKFREFITSADVVYHSNNEILNIASEEAAAYFEGQKTAAETAGIIQSRVKIYLNENK